MAPEHLAKTLVLYFNRPMPHLPALFLERLERSRKTIFRRELTHHRIAFQRGPPYMAEPEEVKREFYPSFSELRLLRTLELLGFVREFASFLGA